MLFFSYFAPQCVNQVFRGVKERFEGALGVVQVSRVLGDVWQDVDDGFKALSAGPEVDSWPFKILFPVTHFLCCFNVLHCLAVEGALLVDVLRNGPVLRAQRTWWNSWRQFSPLMDL